MGREGESVHEDPQAGGWAPAREGGAPPSAGMPLSQQHPTAMESGGGGRAYTDNMIPEVCLLKEGLAVQCQLHVQPLACDVYMYGVMWPRGIHALPSLTPYQQ